MTFGSLEPTRVEPLAVVIGSIPGESEAIEILLQVIRRQRSHSEIMSVSGREWCGSLEMTAMESRKNTASFDRPEGVVSAGTVSL